MASLPAYEKVRSRTNVILMGDSLHDIGMANGSATDHVLSVGFDNSRGAEKLDQYLETFDLTIRDDSDGLELVDLLERLF